MQILYVRDLFGPSVPILFTPNFCRIGEYAAAYDAGAEVTVDGPAVLLQSPEVRCPNSARVVLVGS